MAPENPFFKRIKRHVIGRVRDFFISVTPGFEKICLEELMALPLTVKDAAIVKGGIAFKGRLHDAYLANLSLRTANRILMRIAEFEASSFFHFEKKLSSFPWELFISSSLLPKIHVTSKKSRLFHSDAIADRFKAIIKNRLTIECPQEIQTDFSIEQQVFVRGIDDRFTVSIDSSGEILYKRGIKKEVGKAPIRETIAAAALKLAGYSSSAPLIDPMCGAGTFSFEGAMMAARIPPGWFRTFAFMEWPSFMPRRWEYIRRESEKEIILPEKPFIFASDINPETCSLIEKHVKDFGLSNTITVSCRDFFGFSPSELTDRTGLVVMNPPYGLRLGSKKESAELFKDICQHLKKAYTGWKIALIAPDRDTLRGIPFPLKFYTFPHGGQKRFMLFGTIVSTRTK